MNGFCQWQNDQTWGENHGNLWFIAPRSSKNFAIGMPFGLNICVCSSHSFPSSPPLIFRKDFFLNPICLSYTKRPNQSYLSQSCILEAFYWGCGEDGRLVPAVMRMWETQRDKMWETELQSLTRSLFPFWDSIFYTTNRGVGLLFS